MFGIELYATRSARHIGRVAARPTKDARRMDLARLGDAREPAQRRHAQRQQLLPRKRHEPGRAPSALPGAQIVDEPTPTEGAPDLEGRAERQEGLAASS